MGCRRGTGISCSAAPSEYVASMTEWELTAFLQLQGSVVVPLDCSGEMGAWQCCWCSAGSQALGNGLRGFSEKAKAMEGAVLPLCVGRFWGRRRPALCGRGSGMAAISLLQLLLMGKGRPGARSRGRAVAADMLPVCRRRMLSHCCSACSSFWTSQSSLVSCSETDGDSSRCSSSLTFLSLALSLFFFPPFWVPTKKMHCFKVKIYRSSCHTVILNLFLLW